jgi:hypothetical protein
VSLGLAVLDLPFFHLFAAYFGFYERRHCFIPRNFSPACSIFDFMRDGNALYPASLMIFHIY